MVIQCNYLSIFYGNQLIVLIEICNCSRSRCKWTIFDVEFIILNGLYKLVHLYLYMSGINGLHKLVLTLS